MLSLLCTLLLPAMTGGRCLRRKSTAPSAAEEWNSAADEVPSPVAPPEYSEETAAWEIDYFSQARKALSERSPFDGAEETSTSGAGTLPSGLASMLNRHGDNRRRQKKSHPGVEKKKKKKSSRAGEKARGNNIWVETEEYFRGLTLSDIDTLFEASSLSRLVSSGCFSVPRLENAPRLNVVSSDDAMMKDALTLGSVVSSDNEKKADEEVENEDGLLEMEMESIDNVAAENDLPQDDKNKVDFDSCVSLDWLLGCRSKVSLTSERPSKKRKLLGRDAGLERVVMTCPCDGDKPFCHFCGRGDTDRDSNGLVVCSSCKVAVHRKCYGVQDNVDESWLCSWCKRNDGADDSVNPCVLCPKKGGALKPFSRSLEGFESDQYAHLFCCLWMPEVYIDDLKKMEPLMIVGGIKENRSKSVCNVCKVKCGTCVRCSHGTCRTSFHPLCARESRHRMEVWAKYGDDNVELRAFCLKHSELQESRSISSSGDSMAVDRGFSVANCLPATLPVTDEQNSKISCPNGRTTSDSGPDENVGVVIGGANENVDASDSHSFALLLKKLIDKGKVDLKDVALEIGISPDALTTNIDEAFMAPAVRDKIIDWLKVHVCTSSFQKGVNVKFNLANASKDDSGAAADGTDTFLISELGLLDPVAVKSVPPRRRTVSNVRILEDNKVICSSAGVPSENGVPVDKFRDGQPDLENAGSTNEVLIPDATELNLTKTEALLTEVQGNTDKPNQSSVSGCVSEEQTTACLQISSMLSDQHGSVHAASKPTDSGLIKSEANSSYIHPYIKKKLLKIHNGDPFGDVTCPGEGENSLVQSSGVSGFSSIQNQLSCIDISNPDGVNMLQLDKAGKMEPSEFSPGDQVEGELIHLQCRLLQNAVAKKSLTDNLIYNIVKSLPQEIEKAHQQRWDAVTVNQYLRGLREAKKQGRKERRHKEAQAVLAAATAAAAASSRVSSFRKDSLDESMQPENLLKLDTLSGRTGASSQSMPRAKETLSRLAVTRTSSEKYSDFGVSNSDFSKEQPRSCDICRRSETMLNPIIVCSGCKVPVHLDCYRSVKETIGPWYCELCEDLSSRSSVASTINFWEKPYVVAECALCGGTTGAFRKSSTGQWVHAFCAEWVFESTFRRGQIKAVEGMETVMKGVDTCCICRRKLGVCMKCCYGHCQTTFHPSCARSAGLYMTVRTAGGKQQHKAYCEKHSFEQKAKAETQKHGIEELRSMKQIRVELERLRLLCERIVKREKLKRELVLCSHDILAFKRDHVARSVLVHSPFILPDGSSESATTSLKGNTEGYRSCSEAVQRSDDVTVDSSVAVKHRVRVPVSMDIDPKLDDDCSTSQSHYNHKILERMQFSDKQVPHRALSTSRILSDEFGWRSKSRKPNETFGKELIMTSDEATVKNLRLPKGYAYVPADCLSNDKQSDEDVYASEPVEHDR